MGNFFSDDVLQDALVSNTDKNLLYSFICPNCQTEMFSKNSLDTCVVCGTALSTGNNKTMDDYSKFIPFTIQLDEAVKTYKKKVMFNPLVPIIFKRKKTIKSITPVYVPSYLVNININGETSFLAGDKISSDGKSITKKYNVKGYNNFDYKNILISLWSKLDIMKSKEVFNYNYQDMKDLKLEEINEIVIAPDLNAVEEVTSLNEKIVNKSLSVIKKSVSHELKKLTSNEMKTNLIEHKKLLIPIYFINIKYKGNDYQCIMNGTNGKVTFKLAFGFMELIISSILIFIIIFGISFLLAKVL